jgi:hypothetical protein
MKDNKKYLAILLLLGGIWYFKKDKKVAVISTSTTPDESDTPIQGCTDATALNYDSTATVDDGLCEYDAATPDVIGCMDSVATNYNSEANTELDGSCEYAEVITEVMGCTDPTADNYNPAATQDDTSCSYICDDMDLDGICDDDEVAGCTDASATNYNPSATDDNGSCQYEEVIEDVLGCTDIDADNYNPAATIDDENCIYSVLGCNDSAACNYDSAATADDGSCVFAEENYDCDGNCLNDADGDGVCDPYEVSGCTDPTSITYNSAATDDDGSCQYYELGCTNPNAENYSPSATEDDGTCIVSVSASTLDVINYVIDVFIQSNENDGFDQEYGYWEALAYLSPFYDFSAIAQSFGIGGCGNDPNEDGGGWNSCEFVNELTNGTTYEDLIDDGYTFEEIFIPTIPVSQWGIAGSSGCYLNPDTSSSNPYCAIVPTEIVLIGEQGQYNSPTYTWQDWVDEYNNWMATGNFNVYVGGGR